MKLVVVVWFLCSLFLFAKSQPFTKVFIGFDDSVGEAAKDAAMILFNSKIQFSIAELLQIDNETEIDAAVEAGMQILYLCPSNAAFVVSAQISQKINEFVSTGGILIYSAQNGDRRAVDVSQWLENGLFNVISSTPYGGLDIKEYYEQFFNTGGNFRYYNYEDDYRLQAYEKPQLARFRAQATNSTLNTAFAHSDRHHRGLPFQWMTYDLYWIQDYNHNMILTTDNREHCMFLRSGYYGYGYDRDNNPVEGCFLFAFPHGNGHVVELSTVFDSVTVLQQPFIKTTIRAIEAALSLNNVYPIHDKDVILARYTTSNSNWLNLMTDLSSATNVFVWRNPVYTYEAARLLDITNANVIVTNQIYVYYPGGYDTKKNENNLQSRTAANNIAMKGYISNPFVARNALFYSNFVYAGGNLVVAGDVGAAVDLFNGNYFFDEDYFMYTESLGSSPPFVQEVTAAAAFTNIDSLPYLPETKDFYVNDPNNCQFSSYYCSLAFRSFYNGHVSLLGWDFSKNYYVDNLDGYYYNNPDFTRANGWPNVEWRTALIAALEPLGAPEELIPVFDYEYLPVLDTEFKVALFLYDYVNEDSAANVQHFLNESNIETSIWRHDGFITGLGNSLQEANAILIPGGNGRPIFYFSTQLQDTIREFVYYGGNIVATGNSGRVALREVMGNLPDLFSRSLSYPGLPQKKSVTTRLSTYIPGDFVFPIGYDFTSHYVPNTIFSEFYQPDRSLPAFIPGSFTTYNAVRASVHRIDGYFVTDYCPYTMPVGSYNRETYCGVFSEFYGSGSISYISNSFEDTGTGPRSTFLNNNPWARVLNIALGAHPNDPSQTPTVTPSPSVTPTMTPTPSFTPTTTPTMTPTKSQATSESNSPTPSASKSPSSSPSATRSATASPSTSPSLSSSRSASSSVTKSKSDSPSFSPSSSVSQTSTSSLIPSQSLPNFPSPSSSPSPISVSPIPSDTQSPTESPNESKSKSSSSTTSGANQPSEQIAPPIPIDPPIALPSSSSAASPTGSPSKLRSAINGNISPSQFPSRAPVIFPTSAAQGCGVSCGSGAAQVVVNEPNSNGNQENNANDNVDNEIVLVTLISTSGEFVGSLGVPEVLAASGPLAIQAVFVNHVGETTRDIGSSIVDITVTDSSGNTITELSKPLEICLQEDGDADDACLGFFDISTGDWECEDECLKKEGGNTYCGTTDHLTSFALLLDGGGRGNKDPCNSSEEDYVLAWVSLALVALVLCFIFFGIGYIEYTFRRKQLKRRDEFKILSKRVSELSR